MRIDPDICMACGECIAYCPVGAIHETDLGVSEIDMDECVECGVCAQEGVCPSDGIFETENPWPRSVRGFFSNPRAEHKETRIPGRGTEEMKTNDVTGRFRYGEVGMAMEVGRPGTGTRFHDVQILTMAMADLGIRLEPQNPVTHLIVDGEKGLLNPDVLNERVLSAIVEFTIPIGQVPAVIDKLRQVEGQLSTVFSVDLICKVHPDGSVPTIPLMDQLGIPLSINGKNNVGLGRPYFEEGMPS
jgi:NAD-dependent dihydropyrimidine dehydrogenase PreA subunit